MKENMIIRYTIIFPKQDNAISAWKELLKDWFKFRENWLYYKGKEEVQVWYDDTIHETMNKIEILEPIKSKKKERKKKQ